MEGIKMFVGVEAEGPRQGLTTLFVPAAEESIPKHLTPEAFVDGINAHRISCVYFGAGCVRGLLTSQVPYLVQCLENGVRCTVELCSASVVRFFPELLSLQSLSEEQARLLRVVMSCNVPTPSCLEDEDPEEYLPWLSRLVTDYKFIAYESEDSFWLSWSALRGWPYTDRKEIYPVLSWEDSRYGTDKEISL